MASKIVLLWLDEKHCVLYFTSFFYFAGFVTPKANVQMSRQNRVFLGDSAD